MNIEYKSLVIIPSLSRPGIARSFYTRERERQRERESTCAVKPTLTLSESQKKIKSKTYVYFAPLKLLQRFRALIDSPLSDKQTSDYNHHVRFLENTHTYIYPHHLYRFRRASRHKFLARPLFFFFYRLAL